ncbi:response regulator [bacterium]|nr:response regulator [bacterium]
MDTILIVDDLEENRYLLHAILTAQGFKVIEACHGAEALEKAHSTTPDLIISDILMPVMDGFTLCRQWKQDPVLHSVPFIFYTATYTDEKDRKLALSLGAERFLIKPLEPMELLAEVQEVLAETRAKGPSESPALTDEAQDHSFYKEYSSVLVTKLEDKVNQLEQTNRNLEQAIVELKDTERQLRTSEFLLQSVVDGMTEPIILFDPNATIKVLNQAALHYFGRSSFEIVGHTCSELHHDRTEQCQSCELLVRVKNNQSSSFERRGCLYPERFEQVSVYALDSPPDDAGSTVVRIADITEAKRLQEHLLQQEKLASIGELAAGVAHEINNPINGIMNYAQLLIEDHQDPKRLDDFPQRILVEADRVVKIVRNLLSFARQSDDQISPVDLRPFLLDTVQLMEKQLADDDIRLTLDLPGSFPLILGNGPKMQQVFLNLISNARYALNARYAATHPDKSLVIRANTTTDQDQSWLTLQFIDAGTGIPKDHLHRICDPFFSTKPRGEGVGLGLSISYGIIKEQSGKLSFDSEIEKGTTVTVTLPVMKP